MSAHALLGPSGAKRWMTCTPSARFEEQFEDVESEFAKEGTAAHELSELLLRVQIGGHDGADIEEAKEFMSKNPYYNAEMEEAVGLYLDIVNEKYAQAQQRDPSAILMIEQRLDFSDWVPEGFGTGDAVIIGGGILEVIDLKYGKGVPVFAEDNPQLRLYGLGAYSKFSIIYDIHTIKMTIVQPRLNSVTENTMATADLIKWADEEVKPKAALAWEGKGDYVSGEHCGFCKGKPRCRALADHNLALAKFEFEMPNKLKNEEIGEILGKIDSLTKWAAAIKEYALAEAENKGVKWPGWKLVEGKSNRVITDVNKAVDILLCDGYAEATLYKPREVLGLTGLESLVGKKKLNTLLNDLIIKPPGKPTLVKESDKRPELNSAGSAASDFKKQEV